MNKEEIYKFSKEVIKLGRNPNLIRGFVTGFPKSRFTPKSNNRRTHKRLLHDGKKFRSSWEVRFYMYKKDRSIDLEYETLRVPYKYLGNKHIYIVDFIDRANRIVYEVKPSSMIDDKTMAKEEYLIKWCIENNYNYKFIDEEFFNDRQIFEKYKI